MTSAPDWTDFNESDPGITLLQLFAYLAISVLFTAAVVVVRRWWRSRLDQVAS